jgi:hypothetical protein
MPHSVKYGASNVENMGRTVNALRLKDLGLNVVPGTTLRRHFDCKNLRATYKKITAASATFPKKLKRN